MEKEIKDEEITIPYTTGIITKMYQYMKVNHMDLDTIGMIIKDYLDRTH